MKVGIIANPASGKDIRRLVAHGSVFDNQEKVRMVRRILTGIAAAGVRDVVYMPEGYGIVPRAEDDLGDLRGALSVAPLDMCVHNAQEDTVTAAGLMEKAGADVIVVLGGDGTSRAACKGARGTPLMPLSTGTNNVFPFMIEATAAGLAAGALARGDVTTDEGCREVCLLEVLVNGEPTDIALVDAAVYDDIFIGSRAVWDLSRVPQLFLARCKADNIGLSAVGGQLCSIAPEDPRGLALTLDPSASCRVHAAIGPGLFADVGVARMREMLPGEEISVTLFPSVIALDGEREVRLRRNDTASVRLAERGMRVADVGRILECARRHGRFAQGEPARD